MFEPGQDQASGLRQLLRQPPLRLLPVVGSGPVQDAAVLAVELAVAFRDGGYRTLLVDDGQWAAADGPDLPAAQRPDESARVLRLALPRRLCSGRPDAGAAAWLQEQMIAHRGFDLAVLALPEALVGPMLSRLAPETLVLCGPREEDLAGTYALVKRLARRDGLSRFRVLFTCMADRALAIRRQRRLAGVASRYLSVDVGLAGVLAVAPATARPCAGVAGDARAPDLAQDLAPVVDASRAWQLAAVGAARFH